MPTAVVVCRIAWLKCCLGSWPWLSKYVTLFVSKLGHVVVLHDCGWGRHGRVQLPGETRLTVTLLLKMPYLVRVTTYVVWGSRLVTIAVKLLLENCFLLFVVLACVADAVSATFRFCFVVSSHVFS